MVFSLGRHLNLLIIISTQYSKSFLLNPIIRSMPDTNFWHYSLQLNTYKHILETKYNKIVTNLCLVRIHPDNPEQTYELLPVPILTKEMEELFDELKKKNN